MSVCASVSDITAEATKGMVLPLFSLPLPMTCYFCFFYIRSMLVPLSSELTGELNLKNSWRCGKKWVFLCQTSLLVVELVWKRWNDQRRGGNSLPTVMWSCWGGLDITLNCILSLLCRWITLCCKNLSAHRELWCGNDSWDKHCCLGGFLW